MGKIKLIATDLDGTLLDSAKNLPCGFFDTIRELKRRGITFVIASGRQYYNILKIFEPVKDDLVFLSDNGTVVFQHDECLLCETLDRVIVDEALAYSASIPGVHPLFCGVKSVYGEPAAGDFVREVSVYYERRDISIGAVKRGLDDDRIVKVAFFDDMNAADNGYPALSKRFADCSCVTLSGPHWTDIMPPGIDKGSAMRRIQKMFGVAPEECMAFGDYGNDISLLNACAESYAMANATDSLKAAARHTMKWTNDEGGVKRVIDEVLLS